VLPKAAKTTIPTFLILLRVFDCAAAISFWLWLLGFLDNPLDLFERQGTVFTLATCTPMI
jgi:hypothetical protein